MSFHQPLKGLRVVDFCTHGAGPAACKMLADWGADVIKVEPLEGEAGRYTGKTLAMRADEGDNPHAELINANKRSLPLNLKTPEGKEAMDKTASAPWTSWAWAGTSCTPSIPA